MRRVLATLVLIMLLIVPVNQAFAQESKDTLKDMAQDMASVIVDNYGVSGMQYAIMDNGATVLSDSAGVHDKTTNEPITKDTMFGIGSVSKMHVAAATMILVDANKVDIDQPLTTYIKDFTMSDARYKEITPRMLMNHSSGLFGTHYGNSMFFDDNDTRNHDDLLLKLRTERLKSDPGEYSVYCNDGFQLLELLVERVSGLSYSEFLETYISSPLNLKSTKTPLDKFDREKLTKSYFPTIEQALPVENTNVLGAGGIYSTAEELNMFAELLIGNREDILSHQSAVAMQNEEYRRGLWVADETNSFNYGLGWDAVSLAPFSNYGLKALNKGGDTTVYHAALTTLPDHSISIAVLSSGGSSIFNTIFASNVLLEYVKGKGIITDILPDRTFEPAIQVEMPSDLQSYSGLYGTVGATTAVEIKDGVIELPILFGIIPPQQYVYTGDGQFTSNDGSVIVSFDEQTNGITYLKLNSTLSFPGVGQMGMVTYEYQKPDHNPLDPRTEEAWEKRNGKKYYALDEKINSFLYLSSSVLSKQMTVDMEHGYVNGTIIVDENSALNIVEIPIMNGRDAFDYNFHKQGHIEYLTIDGESYVSEDAVKPIYGGKSSICTIQSEGHAVWFTIDEKSAGKTMTVDIPEGSGFIVYDETGMPVSLSTVSDDNSVVLPKNGLIVFGGEAGGVFKINLN